MFRLKKNTFSMSGYGVKWSMALKCDSVVNMVWSEVWAGVKCGME